jgi:hypothetical protein
MKLRGRNIQGSDVRELLCELTVPIYAKITSKLAGIFRHRLKQICDEETM